MTRSLTAMLNTYIMSNMAPQYCAFNRGTWRGLETVVRRWAEEKGEIYVITGAIFDGDGDGDRDNDLVVRRAWSTKLRAARVAVANYYYKIVATKKPDGSVDEAIAIALPHNQHRFFDNEFEQLLADNVHPISWIEARTGLQFFSDLPAADRTALVDATPTLWTIPGSAIDIDSLTGNCNVVD